MIAPRRRDPAVRSHTVPLYGQRVYVSFGDTLEDAYRALPKPCDGMLDDEDIRDTMAAAITSACDASGVVFMLFVRRHVTSAILAHEALHATRTICQQAGIGPMDDKNDEAYAYVMSWMMGGLIADYQAQRKNMVTHKGDQTCLTHSR